MWPLTFMNSVKEWCWWSGCAAPTRHHDWSEFCSAPQEGDQQSQHAKTLAELQARKNAIDITGAICRTATDLLHRSHSQPGTALHLTFATVYTPSRRLHWGYFCILFYKAILKCIARPHSSRFKWSDLMSHIDLGSYYIQCTGEPRCIVIRSLPSALHWLQHVIGQWWFLQRQSKEKSLA